ncbi:hypothetical protein IQ215_07840 [Cyanobacterium stanieri LEGE 03274]|uniref:Uncharacterized protein n=1 Tax=Cyanobacterium stanieri LEGE 03274 TaxID=1828756 RepID=A0ABR9V442_9CHRO|nr:hypothetical protein [Cyanobacterium stanieri]MBE9222607.1 hypothetical protein [Cyanobacterium stanieri LEGE 03274]
MLNQRTSLNNRQKNNPKGRYYLGFCYKGDAQKLIEVISQQINEYDLSKLIPLLRVEKKDKKNKRGSFYFFLAIDNVDNPQLKIKYQQFKDKILVLSYFYYPAVPKGTPNNFSYEQIKSMVGNAHDVLDYTNPIPYQKNQEKDIQSNPFTFDFTPAYLLNGSEEKKYQHLLYWLSSIGNCSWQLFKQTCELLNLKNPQRIIRRLKLLGHIEISDDGKKCFINPPIIIKILSNSEEEKFILCGQRNQKLISILTNYGEIIYSSHPLKNAPYTIEIKFNHSLDLKNIIQEIKTRYNLVIYYSDLTICQLENLPNFEQWFENLPTLLGIIPSLYDWKYLVNNDFTDCLNPDKTGMYQMFKHNQEKSLDAINSLKIKPVATLFYDRDKQYFKQGNWYGLRFLTLKKNNEPILWKYDVNKKRLAIPYSQRLPELYERLLVLSSGILPSYSKTEDENIWLIYENISEQLLDILIKKLSLSQPLLIDST